MTGGVPVGFLLHVGPPPSSPLYQVLSTKGPCIVGETPGCPLPTLMHTLMLPWPICLMRALVTVLCFHIHVLCIVASFVQPSDARNSTIAAV